MSPEDIESVTAALASRSLQLARAAVNHALAAEGRARRDWAAQAEAWAAVAKEAAGAHSHGELDRLYLRMESLQSTDYFTRTLHPTNGKSQKSAVLSGIESSGGGRV